MPLPRLTRLKTVFLLILFTGRAFCASEKITQPFIYIDLQNQRLPIIPNEFFIAGIDDERIDVTSIGKLIPAVNVTAKTAATSVDFKGGGTAAIKNFINYNLTGNKTLRPLIIKLRAFSVTETQAANGLLEGHVTLSLQFGLQRDDDFISLDTYTATSTYQRSAGPAQQVEPLLRSSLTNALLYINNWMNVQADSNIKLAKSVKVFFTDYREDEESDTVYYDINRPLKWTDFREKPQNSSNFGAEVFASIGYNEEVKLVKGVIVIHLDIKVFIPKSASWARENAMDSYGLNHEQRHFDMVKLVAEHFKQRILTEKLSMYNYDGPINVDYLDALREMNKLQKQYDAETSHSTNTYQQRQWDIRIDKELLDMGIKPAADQAAAN